MKKLVITSILVGAIGIAAYFTYPVISNRYFSEAPAPVSNNRPIAFHDLNEAARQAELAPPAAEETPVAPGEENAAPPKENKRNVKTFITRDNCDNSCKSFEADPVSLTYCQQVCGLVPVQENPACETKTGLEKDYCQKDLAISKTDAAACEAITDDNIRKTCHNRIAEDIVEKMQSGAQE